MKRFLLTIPMIIVMSACASNDPRPHSPEKQAPDDSPPPQPLYLNFDVIDVNNDERISRDEFVAARVPAPPGQPQPDRDELFDRIDRDNSDFITRIELDEHRIYLH